jgi:NADPH2:quinone reductase
MKAIRIHEFGGPAVMKLEDVPDPKAGPGDVVVRIRAAGVNPVDAYIATGTYPRRPALPYTPARPANVVTDPNRVTFRMVEPSESAR